MPTVSPRTDAVTEGCVGRGSPWSYIRAVDLCRELESDLAVALAERDAAKAELKSLLEEPFFREHQHALHRAMVAEAERDALAARVEKAEASRWQPIETCPESCRGEYPKYVLFYNGYHIGVGFCYPSEDGDGGTLYLDETDQIVTPRPTHWMPPPLPPGNDAALSREEKS